MNMHMEQLGEARKFAMASSRGLQMMIDAITSISHHLSLQENLYSGRMRMINSLPLGKRFELNRRSQFRKNAPA
jgi:hypothetical protein